MTGAHVEIPRMTAMRHAQSADGQQQRGADRPPLGALVDVNVGDRDHHGSGAPGDLLVTMPSMPHEGVPEGARHLNPRAREVARRGILVEGHKCNGVG